MFEKGRHRIADVMQMDELPMDREVDDIDWLKSYYLAGMIKDSRGRLNVEAARKKTIRQGRAAIKKVLVALFQRKMTLREDEKGGIQNMAQTVESLEVMKAIHSFAVTDPSIGAYFLNNLSLVKPGKRARKIADQFDFKSIIENVVDAAEDDMDIAIELAKALNNEHTDIAIANVEFSDIKSRIIKHPLAHPNMAIALIRSFDLDSVKNIVLRLARSNGNEEYKELLMEVLAYISSYTHKMTEEVYKYHSILKDTRGQTKGPELYKAQFPKAIKEIETISEMINILMAYDEDNSNLFIGGITEKLNGLRFIFERGNAQYLVKYYESLQVSIIDEDAPLSESTVVVMRHNNGTKEKEKKKKKKKRKRPTGPISVTGNDNGKKCKRPKKGAGKKSQFPKPKAVKKVERERGW